MLRGQLQQALNHVQATIDLTDDMRTRQKKVWDLLNDTRMELALHGNEMGWKVRWDDERREWLVR